MGDVKRESFYDANLVMKDAGLVAASAAATVGGVAKVIDFGAGLMEGKIYVDVTAIEIASNDEIYTISLQVSSTSDISATYEEVATLILGANEVLRSDVDSAVGRYILPFRNQSNGTIYRYGRLYTTVAGTIATGGGINYVAWIGKE